MKTTVSLYDLIIDHLQDMRTCEELLLIELPLMLQRITHSELKPLVNEYERRTRRRIERIDHIFDLLELVPRGGECDAMESLLKSGIKKLIKSDNHSLKEIELTLTVQSISHLKISTYSAMVFFTEFLEMDEVSPLLRATLEEEKENDKALGEMIAKILNKKAHSPYQNSGMGALQQKGN